jgi:hypothetical protein
MSKEEGEINWNKPASHLDCLIRAFRSNGTLNGCGAPPARQKGAVDIDAAINWNIQHNLRE